MTLANMGYRGLDPNKTVWQRLNLALREVMDEKEADRLTPLLFPYVKAEQERAIVMAETRKKLNGKNAS